ncbi:MAG TPA: hypothetical protein V6D00_10880 [Pantanalinema sp.]
MTATEIGASITFSPRWWNMISSTRIFMASFCGHSFGDEDLSDKIAMSAHELLENAVKYSVSPDAPVNCTMRVQEDRVIVSVQNEADSAHSRVLQEEFAIVLKGDPMEMYIAKMQDSLMSEKNQLGLARIRAEGDAELRLITNGNSVIIEASFRLPESAKGLVA